MFNKFLVHRIGSLKVLSDTKLILDNQGGLIYDQVGTNQILQRFHFQRISYSTKINGSRPDVSTTPITAMGCRQCLPLSVVQLKGKHCRNGVVDTFGQALGQTIF